MSLSHRAMLPEGRGLVWLTHSHPDQYTIIVYCTLDSRFYIPTALIIFPLFNCFDDLKCNHTNEAVFELR